DDTVEQVILDRRFDLDLGQKIDDVLSASIQLGMALLPAEALDLGHGNPLYADGRQGLADLVELERFDDCGYQFHFSPLKNCADLASRYALDSESLLHEHGAGRLADVLAGDRVHGAFGVGVAVVRAEAPAVYGVGHPA